MRVIKAAVIPALLLGLTACGHGVSHPAPPAAGPTGTPKELAETAISNGRAAGSVTATLKAQVMGWPVSGKVTVDSLGRCAASLDTGSVGHVEFLKSGDRGWAKVDKPIFGSAVPSGKYATASAASVAMRSFTFFCDSATAHSELRLEDPRKLAERTPATLNGVKTRVLATPDGETVSITDAATPYVVRVASGPHSEPYDITFGDYGKPLTFTLPPSDQTVPVAEDPGEQGSTLAP